MNVSSASSERQRPGSAVGSHIARDNRAPPRPRSDGRSSKTTLDRSGEWKGSKTLSGPPSSDNAHSLAQCARSGLEALEAPREKNLAFFKVPVGTREYALPRYLLGGNIRTNRPLTSNAPESKTSKSPGEARIGSKDGQGQQNTASCPSAEGQRHQYLYMSFDTDSKLQKTLLGLH